jgi:hypothetical protein
MGHPPVLLRPFAAGDEASLNQAFNRAFGAQRSLPAWRAKFFDPTFIMLAVAGEHTVVAQYAALPVRLRVPGGTVRAGQIVDVFALPEARRGLGAARLFLATAEAFFDRFGGPQALSVLFGFPGRRHFRLGLTRLGYDAMPPEKVPVWTAPPSPRRRFSVATQVWDDPDPQVWDSLWSVVAPRYPVAVVRDTQWFQHRFPATHDYRGLLVTRRGRPALAAVTARQGRRQLVVDLLWDGEPPALLRLLEEVRAEAWERRLEVVELWLAGDPQAESVLRRCGWRCQVHPDLHRVARSFDSAVEVGDFPGRFLLTLADTDLV